MFLSSAYQLGRFSISGRSAAAIAKISTSENVIPPSSNSTVDAGRNLTDTGPDDPQMEIKRDLSSDESDVVATFVAEAMEAQLGKRGMDSVDLRKKGRFKFSGQFSVEEKEILE